MLLEDVLVEEDNTTEIKIVSDARQMTILQSFPSLKLLSVLMDANDNQEGLLRAERNDGSPEGIHAILRPVNYHKLSIHHFGL